MLRAIGERNDEAAAALARAHLANAALNVQLTLPSAKIGARPA
jgi:DNA-binding GntR family transcriptional regulator